MDAITGSPKLVSPGEGTVYQGTSAISQHTPKGLGSQHTSISSR